jgi:hypothetical protein
LKLELFQYDEQGTIQRTLYSTFLCSLNQLDVDEDWTVFVYGMLITHLCDYYSGFIQILEETARSVKPILFGTLQKTYPSLPVGEILVWLTALKCIEHLSDDSYKITAFGQEQCFSQSFSPIAEIESSTPVVITQEYRGGIQDQFASLIQELLEASTDTKNPKRFETVVGCVFKFLGFAIEQRGEAGNTDVIARATIGEQSYSIIIDAKTRHDGTLREIEPFTLKEHQRKNGADYVVIIANKFSNGKVLRQAQEHNILLMTTGFLKDWLSLHKQTQLNLLDYKCVFSITGEITHLPNHIQRTIEYKKRLAYLVVQIIDLLHEGYDCEIFSGWTVQQIYTTLALRSQGTRYSLEEVQQAAEWITHPLISVAYWTGTGLQLTIGKQEQTGFLTSIMQKI